MSEMELKKEFELWARRMGLDDADFIYFGTYIKESTDCLYTGFKAGYELGEYGEIS